MSPEVVVTSITRAKIPVTIFRQEDISRINSKSITHEATFELCVARPCLYMRAKINVPCGT